MGGERVGFDVVTVGPSPQRGVLSRAGAGVKVGSWLARVWLAGWEVVKWLPGFVGRSRGGAARTGGVCTTVLQSVRYARQPWAEPSAG